MMKIRMFDIEIDNLSMKQAVEKIVIMAKDKERSSFVLTPNVDHVVKVQSDKLFKEIYDNASLVLADGMPLIWASKLLKKPLKEKVSGSDIFPLICEKAASNNLKVYFLGGEKGVAKKASANLKKIYPQLKVVEAYCPPFGFEKDSNEVQAIIDSIDSKKPDIVFVGLGAPKQEKWIYENIDIMDVKAVYLGIGASFDFIAGTKQRSPSIISNVGLEWFWRFCQEPRRLFKRYFIEDSQFILLVIKELVKQKKIGK